MKIIDIPLDDIEPTPENPNVMTDDQYAALRAEIARRGFVQPLLVRPVEGEKPYRLVDGEHRWSILGELGAESAPCVVEENSETDAKLRTLTMNRLRGRFVPVRLAKLLVSLSQTIPADELAGRLAIDRTELQTYLALGTFTDPLDAPEPTLIETPEPDDSAEAVFVAAPKLAAKIQVELDRLTAGRPEREATVIAKAAKAWAGAN